MSWSKENPRRANHAGENKERTKGNKPLIIRTSLLCPVIYINSRPKLFTVKSYHVFANGHRHAMLANPPDSFFKCLFFVRFPRSEFGSLIGTQNICTCPVSCIRVQRIKVCCHYCASDLSCAGAACSHASVIKSIASGSILYPLSKMRVTKPKPVCLPDLKDSRCCPALSCHILTV